MNLDWFAIIAIVLGNLVGIGLALGIGQKAAGRSPWWSYRFRLACRPSVDDCWWLAPSRSRRAAWTWSRAECASATFAWWQLPRAWRAARRCGAFTRELSLKWL